MCQYRLGLDLLRSSSVKKDLGELVDKFSMSQLYVLLAKKANGILSVATRLSEVLLLL